MLRAGRIVALAALVGCGQLATSGGDASSDAAVDAASTDVTFDRTRDADAALVDEEASAPPDGSVQCGSGQVWCDPTGQYCEEIGIMPPGSGHCVALPTSCLMDRTCACLADAGAPGCGCFLADSGLLVLGCFEP